MKGAVLAKHVLEHLGLLANPIYGRLVLTHRLMVNSVCDIFKDRPLQKLYFNFSESVTATLCKNLNFTLGLSHFLFPLLLNVGSIVFYNILYCLSK